MYNFLIIFGWRPGGIKVRKGVLEGEMDVDSAVFVNFRTTIYLFKTARRGAGKRTEAMILKD